MNRIVGGAGSPLPAGRRGLHSKLNPFTLVAGGGPPALPRGSWRDPPASNTQPHDDDSYNGAALGRW